MPTVIEKIERRAKRIASRKDSRVMPGQPVRISEAAAVRDCARQGDLYLTVLESIPGGYTKVSRPKLIDRQLVPGNTEGAKHCLDSLSGVKLYHPAGWGPTYDQLAGPCFVLTKERTVKHPTHGDVTIPAGFVTGCWFQREFDAEQQRERRNAD